MLSQIAYCDTYASISITNNFVILLMFLPGGAGLLLLLPILQRGRRQGRGVEAGQGQEVRQGLEAGVALLILSVGAPTPRMQLSATNSIRFQIGQYILISDFKCMCNTLHNNSQTLQMTSARSGM